MAGGKELGLALQNHLAICGGTGYRGPVIQPPIPVTQPGDLHR